MKKLIMLLLMLATMATSSKAEDLDSMYTQEMLPIGTEVPDVMLDSIHNVSLKSMRGRYVVLHFWASWCPDCRKDMPAMNELSYVYSSDSIVFRAYFLRYQQRSVAEIYHRQQDVRYGDFRVKEDERMRKLQTIQHKVDSSNVPHRS